MKKILLGIAALLILGVAGFIFVSRTNETSFTQTIKGLGKKFSGVTTSTWKTYTSSKQGFSIKYPSNYSAREESEGIVFVPPEFESMSKQPETLKELPLMVIILKGKSYADLSQELKRESEGARYYEEKKITAMNVQGTEVKIGPKQSAGDTMYRLIRIIPYKDMMLAFLTFATSKEQLEGQGAPLLDAFLSTFQTN